MSVDIRALAAALLICGCVSTPSEPRAPRVDLEWQGQLARLSIHNPQNAERLVIVDPKFSGSRMPPVGVYVRVSDQAGAILRHSTDDGEGWFTRLSLSGDLRDMGFTLSPAEPPAMLTLDEGGHVESALDPRWLVEGLRPETLPEADNCRVQVRVVIYSAQLETVVDRVTSWLDLPCRELPFSVSGWRP